MSLARAGRLMRESKTAATNQLIGIKYGPVSDSLDEWEAVYDGPQDSVYKGTKIYVKIIVPNKYPFEPPIMTTDLLHPNVYESGVVCMSILHAGEDKTKYEEKFERWAPAKSLETCVLSFQQLLKSPNCESSANPTAGKMYTKDKVDFARLAQGRLINAQTDRELAECKVEEGVHDLDSGEIETFQFPEHLKQTFMSLPGKGAAKEGKKKLSEIFNYDLDDDPPDVLKLTRFKKNARRRQSMAKMAKRSNCSFVKGASSESTVSEGVSSKRQTKRKPRRKKEDVSSSAIKSDPDPISSPTKKGSDEDSDEELSDDYVPDLDELLKMPEPDVKRKDELLDKLDKQIADRQKAHEKEMDKLDKDIEAEKRKRIEKKARMKENAKRRNLLETQLTEEKLRKMFKQNLDYLQNIWDGKVESSRHRAFHQSIRTRHALYYMMITDPFTDEQLDWTLDEIRKVWMKTKEEERQHNEYVWKVILAECFIKFYMDFFGVTKEQAVQMISETPLHKKDQLKDMKGSDESEGTESEEEIVLEHNVKVDKLNDQKRKMILENSASNIKKKKLGEVSPEDKVRYASMLPEEPTEGGVYVKMQTHKFAFGRSFVEDNKMISVFDFLGSQGILVEEVFNLDVGRIDRKTAMDTSFKDCNLSGSVMFNVKPVESE